jgi:hypothetical protein
MPPSLTNLKKSFKDFLNPTMTYYLSYWVVTLSLIAGRTRMLQEIVLTCMNCKNVFKPFNDLLSELLGSITIIDSWKDKDATGNSTYMFEL